MPDEPQPTQTHLGGGSPGSPFPSVDEGRFPAGTTLAGRFRILGLLGKGGMGEVYRALDLTLNQMVALKFISHAAHTSEAARLGVAPADLARAAVADLLAAKDDDFRKAAERVLKKNDELYRRLA